MRFVKLKFNSMDFVTIDLSRGKKKVMIISPRKGWNVDSFKVKTQPDTG